MSYGYRNLLSVAYNLSSGDVARQLAVVPETVNRWADKGDLVCVRTPGGVRRFQQDDIDAFIARMAKRQAEVVGGGDAA